MHTSSAQFAVVACSVAIVASCGSVRRPSTSAAPGAFREIHIVVPDNFEFYPGSRNVDLTEAAPIDAGLREALVAILSKESRQYVDAVNKGNPPPDAGEYRREYRKLAAETGSNLPRLMQAWSLGVPGRSADENADGRDIIRDLAQESQQLDPFEVAMVARYARSERASFMEPSTSAVLWDQRARVGTDAWTLDYWLLMAQYGRDNHLTEVEATAWATIASVPCDGTQCPVSTGSRGGGEVPYATRRGLILCAVERKASAGAVDQGGDGKLARCYRKVLGPRQQQTVVLHRPLGRLEGGPRPAGRADGE